VHYRATAQSNRILQQGELFLLDSGGQYYDGTTDITRTVAFGASTPEQRERFTRVLKGHIAIAAAQFPEGTPGSQLDALARQFLWQAGLDYDHGTGHGVGCFLGVHEGPQRISKRGGDAALAAGMVVSNEPGYYKAGEYGIRIENLVTVVERMAGEGKNYLGFETLTCAPIDRRLIEASMLSAEEKTWLNNYHAWVARELPPLLDAPERAWLAAGCEPV
jgi:Xaa-Pro aminopeptidase